MSKNIFISGSEDGIVIVWQLNPPRKKKVIEFNDSDDGERKDNHGDSFSVMHVCKVNETDFISAHKNGTIRFCSISAGESHIYKSKSQINYLHHLERRGNLFQGNYDFLSGSDDGRIDVWSLSRDETTPRLSKTLTSYSVKSICDVEKGQTVNNRRYRFLTGMIKKQSSTPEYKVMLCEISTQGQGALEVEELTSLKESFLLHSISLSKCEQKVVLGACHNSLQLWTLETDEYDKVKVTPLEGTRKEFKAHKMLTCVHAFGTDKFLISLGRSVQIWQTYKTNKDDFAINQIRKIRARKNKEENGEVRSLCAVNEWEKVMFLSGDSGDGEKGPIIKLWTTAVRRPFDDRVTDDEEAESKASEDRVTDDEEPESKASEDTPFNETSMEYLFEQVFEGYILTAVTEAGGDVQRINRQQATNIKEWLKGQRVWDISVCF